ncbi:glycosyltransferase [Modestobacter sp. VKM Ac-2984]|uniref:glycosyltransferase n=1 Tax=Modestobacter sp. VKM Ac-2984 TaxID=3004138 RepID=UPI0022AB03D2|nr:glycosyltransferase [Modestobacter sp. VKM Ac-2984]
MPDVLPYGLDRLREHGLPVVTTAPSTTPPLLRAGLRKAGDGIDWAGRARRAPTANVLLAWDERSGVPAALGVEVPAVTGVIWVTDRPRWPVVEQAIGRGLRRAAQVFVLSSAQVNPLTTRYRLDPRRTTPITFGVDTDFFTAPPDTEVDRDLVVSIGNDRDRDFAGVLDAFRRIRERRSSSRLTIVSETVSPTLVGNAPGVTVIPRLPHVELRALVASASLSLVVTRPNLHASGMTAALESTALGRPAVITATPGMQTYAPADGGVELVPPGDVEAAASACLALLSDRETADGQGEAGRTTVLTGYSTATQAAQLATLARSALSGA